VVAIYRHELGKNQEYVEKINERHGKEIRAHFATSKIGSL
jgi:hypothetical protein